MHYGERHRLPVSEGNDVRLLPSGTEILGCLRTLIGRARLTIHFEIYEWADDSTGRDLMTLLREAQARGVKVRGVVDHHPIARAAGRATFGPLFRAGVRIWERRGRVFHAKVALLDDDLVLIGTANLDSFSFKRNLELNLMVRSRALAKELQEALDEDRTHSRLLTLGEWIALPAYRRAIQNFAYLFWWWL
jgi:cardiolipin synthase